MVELLQKDRGQTVVPALQELKTHGEALVGLSAAALPQKRGRYCFVKALADNVGIIYLGNSASVTAPTGATNATCGIELSAGETLPYIPIKDLSEIFAIGTDAGDGLTYGVFG